MLSSDGNRGAHRLTAFLLFAKKTRPKVLEANPGLDFSSLNQVLNHRYVTIITNTALSIISTKMKECFVFQFDSVLAFFVKNSCLPITE